MKIDRRSFLSFAIGGAVGTGLSPLPLKLLDDSSIWSQNWPWTPVPKKGKITYQNSTCTLCPSGCGISVRKVDDRVVKIEGMKGHPVNNGGLCILGLSGMQLLYGPSRVKSPLKRVGKRGQGEWKEITWKEAISEVSKNLGSLRANRRPHTLACISGSNRGTVNGLLERFMDAFGSPNFIRSPSIFHSYETAVGLTQKMQATVGFDVLNSDFLLSFGSGVLEGWGSPVYMFRANSRRLKNKGKLIQIEPRLSNTAAKSDQWIVVNPGTEAVLTLGFANVIITKSLFNKEFIQNSSKNFTAFKKLVLTEYDPDTVSKITGVDKAAINSVATEFAKARRPMAICGKGSGNRPGSLDEFVAVHALNALTGNINKRGGVWTIPEPNYIKWPEVKKDEMSVSGTSKPRVDGARTDKYPDTKYLLNRFAQAVNSGKKSPVQALLVSDANPSFCLPDTAAFQKALDRIPFVVSFSSYMDETTQQADLILPNHTYLERFEDVPAPSGYHKPLIGLVRPVVKPQFNTRHLGDTIIQIANNMGPNIAEAFPWGSYLVCLSITMRKISKLLVKQGFWTKPEYKKPFSGKFNFAANSNIKFKPVKTEGNEKSYPLVLIPVDSMRLANGFIANTPFLTKTVPDTVLKGNDILVELNPDTAQSLNLSECDYATLTTPKASVKVKIHLFDGIKPGLIGMPTGLGHTGYSEYLTGKGVNFNKLIGPVEDQVSGLDAAWGIRAKLARA
jgi:anaerobic selenocysteine-containing dehydrogenase